MARKRARKESVGLPTELENEVDLFHKGRDKINLDRDADEVSEEDLSEEDIDIYNLGGDGDDDEEEDSDSEGGGRLADRKFLRPSRLQKGIKVVEGLLDWQPDLHVQDFQGNQ